MRKSLLLSFLAIWSTQVFAGAATTVRLNPDADLVVNARLGGVTVPLGSAEPSGDATSESAPAKVYIPMTGINSELDYFIEKAVPNLFTANNSTDVVIFPLYLNSTTDNYLYMTTKVNGSTDYKITGVVQIPFNSSTTNLDYPFEIKVKDICDYFGDCNGFATGQTVKTTTAYFFFSTTVTTALPVGTVANPASYSGGIYFQINMSNRIFTASQLIPTITDIRPGDKRVIIKYDLSAGFLDPKAIRVYNHGSATPVGKLPIRSYVTGALEAKEFTYAASGEVTLTDRVNEVPSNYSILAVDLYKFATVLSEEQTGVSKSIEELLKANQCFLLTAGFGEEHFVISYFRHFRDTVLANSFLGREFIHFYYELAPKYALLLYKNETLRAMVRGVAYVLYFIFNYYLLILAGALISGSGIYLYKKREKIKI